MRPDAAAAWSLIAGLGLGLGVWSAVASVPRFSRPRLAVRVAPYLADLSEEAGRVADRRVVQPLSLLGLMVAPALVAVRRTFGRIADTGGAADLLLRQAGWRLGVEGYRSRQLLAALLGLIGALTLVAADWSGLEPAARVAVPVAGAVLGALAVQMVLRRAAQRRRAAIVAEFPTVVEFLSLSLSAGEGVLDAIRRLARAGSGELSREFEAVAAAVGTGVPLLDALRVSLGGLRLLTLTRCVDAITGAMERGTPISEVLLAQAQDARDASKRDLLEVAGKKEIAMMVPLVFLILPCTVLFAIYPGLAVLRSGL